MSNIPAAYQILVSLLLYSLSSSIHPARSMLCLSSRTIAASQVCSLLTQRLPSRLCQPYCCAHLALL